VVVVEDRTEDKYPSYKNRLSFDPLGLLFGIGSFTYERGLSKRVSLQISPTFVFWGFGDSDITGGGLSVGASYYITGDAPRGFHMTMRLAPGFVSIDDNDGDSDTTFLFFTKFLVGYNWIWKSGFSLGVGGGMQYVHVKSEDSVDAFNGILPTLDFNLGFGF